MFESLILLRTRLDRNSPASQVGRRWHRQLKHAMLVSCFDLIAFDVFRQSQRPFESVEAEFARLIVAVPAAFATMPESSTYHQRPKRGCPWDERLADRSGPPK
jgi:hypothetical protein